MSHDEHAGPGFEPGGSHPVQPQSASVAGAAGRQPEQAIGVTDTDAGSASTRQRRRRQGPAAVVRDIVVVLVGALLVSTVVRHSVAQVFEIPSTSMTNTLLRSDRVVVSKVSDVHRGDVVVFKDPGGWLEDEHGSSRGRVGRAFEDVGLLPSTSNDHLIKRLIGMPGDHVMCCDARGRVTVNGRPLDEQAYLWVDPATGRQDVPARRSFDVVVPAGHVWVMGDHRSGSRDSRCHLQDVTPAGGPSGTNAFVPLDDVLGPALAIVAPLRRVRHLGVPSTFTGVPEPTAPAPAQAVITTGGDCQA